MMVAFMAGFALSLSLILAIGAQNAFVLRQGLSGAHVGAVVAVCCVSEGLLIAAGVAGASVLIEQVPWSLEVLRWGGVIFLAGYGARALLAAWRGTATLDAASAANPSMLAAVGTATVLTWANPHVYLDTLGLIGAVSAQYWPDHWAFAAGALTASCLFFTALGHGARLLAPLFARPGAWRLLDGGVGVLMLLLAGKLALGL